jgi:hypothetical protein
MTFVSRFCCCLSAAMCLLSPRLLADARPTITEVTFQVPGSIGTYPQSINNSLTVTGFYLTANGVTHGFLRTPDGTITPFDVPGSTFTQPVSINDAGVIAGTYEVSGGSGSLAQQGFVRNANGTFTLFGNTSSGDSSFQPQPVKINASGEVIGNYPDLTTAPNAFIFSASGAEQHFTLSDGSDYPTLATGLNNSGAVVGYSTSGSLLEAGGFYWSGQGATPTPFSGTTGIDVPGAYATFPTAINAGGTIAGCYSMNTGTEDAPVLNYYDFVYQPSGTYTTLSVPGAVPPCVATHLELVSPTQNSIYGVVPPTITINDSGIIVGMLIQNGQEYGFMQNANGNYQVFPGSTTPTSLNNANAITGYRTSGASVAGYIEQPVTTNSSVVLTVKDPQGFFWDGGNSQRGATVLQVYQDYPSTGQNWTWTPVTGGFTICDLGICLSDNGTQVVMSTKADAFVITSGDAVQDVSTGRYIENASKPGNAAYLSTGTAASPWSFSLTLH